jgi:membrane associated rhomboid family serine protease
VNTTPDEPSRPAREPAFKAPWTVLALIALLIAAHAARVLTGVDVGRFALTGDDLRAGRWTGLISYLFDHASWAHVAMNAAFTLAFGAPVARYLGTGPRGAAAFFAFFLICGIVAALAYAGFLTGVAPAGDANGAWALVGASGAASGLLGAAARLIEVRGCLGRIGGRTVVGMTLAWIAVNAVLGLSGLTPGAAGLPVAWEAHIFGYFAGLLLIGPVARLAGVHAPITD